MLAALSAVFTESIPYCWKRGRTQYDLIALVAVAGFIFVLAGYLAELAQ